MMILLSYLKKFLYPPFIPSRTCGFTPPAGAGGGGEEGLGVREGEYKEIKISFPCPIKKNNFLSGSRRLIEPT